jgi:hypothetical protein
MEASVDHDARGDPCAEAEIGQVIDVTEDAPPM